MVLVAAGMGAANVAAQNGQPHSLKADALFSDVELTWKAPAENITLEWHDGSSYNGVDGKQNNPEGAAVLYAGAKFAAADLLNYVGETVDSIRYFEYRNVSNVRVLVYENGTCVRDQKVDVSGFQKNSWRKVALSNPYTIKEGTDVIFSVRFEHGYNQDFVANTDRSPIKGKGNIYSYDGKTWKDDAPGDFMITAVLHNATDTTQALKGYNVYRDGQLVNTGLIAETAYTLSGETDGEHTYKVGAVYEDAVKTSSEVTVALTSAAKMLAPAATFSGTANELSGTLAWQAPLQVKDGELTWSNKTFNQGIGGTAKSSPKVWIKQEFDANDLLAAQGAKITSLNAYLQEAVTGATVFIIKNGVIDYSEAISEDSVAALATGAWNNFKFSTPYELETGNTYALGLYYTHAVGLHPVGVDTAEAVNGKGNSFSISSPNSKNFNNSKPSWKTLSSGDITGNFMLTAVVENVVDGAAPKNYKVLRDGVVIASDLTANTLADEVTEPGTYTYTLVTEYEDKLAPEQTAEVTYTMPAVYAAPTIVDYSLNETTNAFNLQWSNDAVELKHYDAATYMAGFDEDMTLLYGTKFSAQELAPYAGYQLKSIKFGIGEALDAFKIEVLNGSGERLFSKSYTSGDIEPGYLYSTTLEQPVTITGDEDLYLAYNATLPAGKSPIYLDGGPLVDGGAMISLSDGSSWLKLGTIASTFSDYNIVIGATAIAPAETASAPDAEVELSRSRVMAPEANTPLTISATQLRQAVTEGFGVEASMKGASVNKAPRKAETNSPKAKSYKVYCNGEVVEETAATEYNTTISNYGVFNYAVTTIFENGWESPASRVISITNTIPQKAAAPYDLDGTLDNSTLKLTWKVANEGMLSYEDNTTSDMVIGMTGTGTREAYAGIRFTTDTLALFAGQKITHISFKLASTDLYSAAVFVMDGGDIVYEQDVEVSTLTAGRNIVRLNTPYVVGDERELTVGYHCTYANGTKPHVLDASSAVLPGYSDLISSSASYDYWYSLKTKYKQDYNWRISAILAKDDVKIDAPSHAPRKEATAQTYNVYRDGMLLASGITDLTYDVLNAANGTYRVTAVTEDGAESAESNAVVLNLATGISAINVADAQATEIYNINGVRLNAADGAQAKGIYIVKMTDGTAKKVVK